MKKIKITDIETCPKYFRWIDTYVRVSKNVTRLIKHQFGYDIDILDLNYLSFYFNEEVQPITKEEFEAELNKAFQEILNA